MTRLLLPPLFVLLASLLGGCAERAATAPDSAAPPALPWPATVHDVAWLAGDWIGVSGGACFVERWLPPAEGSLLGVGRHTRGGPAPQTTRETMRLMESPEGLVMVVMLEDGQVTRFPLASVGAEGFLARRADAGWPGTIAYARQGAAMVVTLAGGPDERRVDVAFERVPAGEAPSCVGRLSP